MRAEIGKNSSAKAETPENMETLAETPRNAPDCNEIFFSSSLTADCLPDLHGNWKMEYLFKFGNGASELNPSRALVFAQFSSSSNSS